MSEKKLKRKFGKLGFIIIQDAEKEIKKINKQTLFQIADIKKRYKNLTEEKSQEIKKNFAENYKNILNNRLSKIVIESNRKILKTKMKILEKIIDSLKDSISTEIEEKSKAYINYLIEKIGQKEKLKNQKGFSIVFRENDYEYFQENEEKLEDVLSSSFEIKKSKKEFLGGFKIKEKNGLVSYDYTLEEHIEGKKSKIEKLLPSLFPQSKIDEIQQNFRTFIQNKIDQLQDDLKKYDRISTE